MQSRRMHKPSKKERKEESAQGMGQFPKLAVMKDAQITSSRLESVGGIVQMRG